MRPFSATSKLVKLETIKKTLVFLLIPYFFQMKKKYFVKSYKEGILQIDFT